MHWTAHIMGTWQIAETHQEFPSYLAASEAELLLEQFHPIRLHQRMMCLDPGRKAAVALPERKPDADTTYDVTPQQAMLYRLCGDTNPLHADPAFARAAGFPAPILHGLCTYGVVCRALVGAVLDGDADPVTDFRARFTGVVYPGETLRTRAWLGESSLRATTTVPARDEARVLDDVELTWA